ncbi:MAG: alpha/beta hydrolase [Planctomycetota bacterium]|nr:alpha/beta hydrolase [Planctomycetota bacterium]
MRRPFGFFIPIAGLCLHLMLLGIAVCIGGCSRFDILNSTIPACGYLRTSNLPYGKLARQKLDIYVPRRVIKPAKVVVFFYGGDWQTGEKENYRFTAEALTSEGYIAVLPNYRVYPEVRFPAFVQDAAMAVRWVHDNIEHFGGNGCQIYLMGHSAGAHIVALLTFDAHYLTDAGVPAGSIRASAGLAGPYDFVLTHDDANVFLVNRGESFPQMEPIHFARFGAPPMLFLQGLQDGIVEPGNANRMAAQIKKAGGKATSIGYPQMGHAELALALAWPFRWLAPVLRDTATFFRENP